MKIGFDAELIQISNGCPTESRWQSLDDDVGCDGNRFYVEVRSIADNKAEYVVRSLYDLVDYCAYNDCIIQSPDHVTGCHIHLDGRYRSYRPNILIELGKLIESKRRSETEYSALENENREKWYGTEFRALPSGILSLPWTLEAIIKYMRLWMRYEAEFYLPYELERKVREIDFRNRYIAYGNKHRVIFSGDYFAARPDYKCVLPVYFYGLAESRGMVIWADPRILPVDEIMGAEVISRSGDLRIGLPRKIRENEKLLSEMIEKIIEIIDKSTITIDSTKQIDGELADFIFAKCAEIRIKIKINDRR